MKKLITLAAILSLVFSIVTVCTEDIKTTSSDLTAGHYTILGSEDHGGIRG